jgi:hypothetical protein
MVKKFAKENFKKISMKNHKRERQTKLPGKMTAGIGASMEARPASSPVSLIKDLCAAPPATPILSRVPRRDPRFLAP